MAITVLSQHFYPDNLLQAVTLITTATGFETALTDLRTYVSSVNDMPGYTATLNSAETLSVSKIRKFVEDQPAANTEANLFHGGFMITANFRRTETNGGET